MLNEPTVLSTIESSIRRSSRLTMLGACLAHWARAGIDLLFPPACVNCDSVGLHLCYHCAQQAEPVPTPFCVRCGRPEVSAHKIAHTGEDCDKLCSSCQEGHNDALLLTRAAALHKEPLRTAILRLKYSQSETQDTRRPELARPLSRYLVACYQERIVPHILANTALVPIDIVIPIPLHSERMKERGFNQAQLLARHFCRAVDLPLAADAIQRVRYTLPQAQDQLNATQRRQNVTGAFRADHSLANMNVLLIDDVQTTGATLNACAKAALEAGAAAIYGLTLTTPANRA